VVVVAPGLDPPHVLSWPTSDELKTIAAQADPAILGAVGEALAGVRRTKSEAKVGMKAEVRSAVLAGPEAILERIRLAEGDLIAAGRIASLKYQPGETFAVRNVVLAPAEPKA